MTGGRRLALAPRGVPLTTHRSRSGSKHSRGSPDGAHAERTDTGGASGLRIGLTTKHNDFGMPIELTGLPVHAELDADMPPQVNPFAAPSADGTAATAPVQVGAAACAESFRSSSCAAPRKPLGRELRGLARLALCAGAG